MNNKEQLYLVSFITIFYICFSQLLCENEYYTNYKSQKTLEKTLGIKMLQGDLIV